MALNAGFTAPIVMALGGWKTERMMRRYAAVLYHRRASFVANAMGCWVVPEAAVEAVLQAGADVNACNDDGTTALWDPWRQRDLKIGLNFGASGLAPIPVGFGDFTNPLSSAYMPDGSFTGAWQYVGLYGGNVIFSTPEEISAYKTWRNQLNTMLGDNKPWTETKLIYSADPFQVTHGIADPPRMLNGYPRSFGYGVTWERTRVVLPGRGEAVMNQTAT